MSRVTASNSWTSQSGSHRSSHTSTEALIEECRATRAALQAASESTRRALVAARAGLEEANRDLAAITGEVHSMMSR